MPLACSMLRPGSGYGRDAFHAGLQRLGYAVTNKPPRKPSPDDVLLIWNRRAGFESHARAFENAGARVIVAENGYLGSDEHGKKLWTMALGHHNGRGKWPAGSDPDRWQKQGIRLEPWRTDGDFILCLPQRSIGEPGIAMPTGWTLVTQAKLAKATRRPVRVRRHPGNTGQQDPLPALKGAWACVTHASGAGLKAIATGIPTFHTLAGWIGEPASTFLDGADIEKPWTGDRVPCFRRVADCQFDRREISSGWAFDFLLRGDLMVGSG